MIRHKNIEVTIGMFILLAFTALIFVIVQTTSFNIESRGQRYELIADFEDATGLKPKAPIRIAGVKIGEVKDVSLDTETYRAKTTLLIFNKDIHIPKDSSISILTEGILGAKYTQITPGFEEDALQNQDVITKTYSGIILENILGQAINSLSSKD